MSLLDIFKPKRFALPVEASRYQYVGIGINAYERSALKLCVPDIKASVPYWQQWGLKDSQITTLFDHDADTQNIKAAVNAAVDRAVRYDVVAIQPSGHGSNLPCVDERDGKKEIFCPVDIFADFERNNVDDIFWNALARKATAKQVTLWLLPFDCCHTGGMTRTLSGITEPRPGVRYLPAPSEARYRGEISRGFKDDGVETNAIIMLGGCEAEEVSYEYAKAGHGALTWGTLEAYKQNKPFTARSLHKFAGGKVTGAFSDQHPVLEGNPNLFDKPLFSPLFQK